MSQINLILLRKGGSGKSFIASLLTQHYKAGGMEERMTAAGP